ncbi:MAG: transposase [Candidatus Roseilinea sp.]|nr:MAG: transposase [Candidatus Roseilinea sp.]
MRKPKYTREFKEQAVELSYSSDKSVAQLAADLGIATNMLHRWRREYRDGIASNGKRIFPGHGRARDEELKRLRKALHQAEMERDILKKAAAYFAQHAR